jgi:hypothetical protein
VTSLRAALFVAAGAPMIAIVLAALLPTRRPRERLEPAPEIGLLP